MSFLPLVKIWVWFSALATLAGWLLSASSQLNRVGYAAFTAVVVIVLWTRSRVKRDPQTSSAHSRPRFRWSKLRWRFSKALPLGFVLLSGLVLAGALLYPPTNHTGLTYRTPRVLNWLAEEHWYWIHSANYRMNNRACGFEWLTAPLLLFTKSDRLLFLFNFLPYLLLPGLIYSVFTRIGVRRRVAWHWMWLLPSGYSFLLQAGSIGNDTFPTVYALAAVDFGCRAWASRRPSDLYLSMLSAALLTGAKASNLPLLLPWAILFFPLIGILARRFIPALGVGVLALMVSFVPTAALNLHYCGDWSGLTLERAGMSMKDPLVGLWGNGFLFLLHNFVPPFFPHAGWWNNAALNILPQGLVRLMTANFELGFHQVSELPSEDWSGLGFGLSVLLVCSVLGAWWHRLRSGNNLPLQMPSGLPPLLRWLVLLAAWVALLAYCVKSGMVTGARLISPYYPLLLPLILIGSHQTRVVRSRWWKTAAILVILIAVPVMVVTPGRPLWPAKTILGYLQKTSGSRLVDRALVVYTVYGERSDPLAKVRQLLPKDVQVVGFMADGDDMDISLWRPFGARRVKYILLGEDGESIRRRGIRFAVVGGAYLNASGVGLEDWLKRTGADLFATTSARLKVAEGIQPWYVVRFEPSE